MTSAVDPYTQKSFVSRRTIDNVLPVAPLGSFFFPSCSVDPAATFGDAATFRDVVLVDGGADLMVSCIPATTKVTMPVDRESPRQPAARASNVPPSSEPRKAPTRDDVVRIESAVVRVLPADPIEHMHTVNIRKM